MAIGETSEPNHRAISALDINMTSNDAYRKPNEVQGKVQCEASNHQIV
jgi:hypothetical protein